MIKTGPHLLLFLERCPCRDLIRPSIVAVPEELHALLAFAKDSGMGINIPLVRIPLIDTLGSDKVLLALQILIPFLPVLSVATRSHISFPFLTE